MLRPVAPSGFAHPMITSSISPGSSCARWMAWHSAWPPIVAPWVMLNAPRQLLQSGVRAVETTTASGIPTIYRIRTRRPNTRARTAVALLPIQGETGLNSRRFAGGIRAPVVRLKPDTTLPIIMNRTDFEARIEQDGAGVITDWNAGAQALFGWTRAEAIGQASN